MSTKNSKRRGRPPVYTGNVKKHIVGLVRKHGLTGAMGILNASASAQASDYEGDPAECEAAAKAERESVKQRNTKLVPEPLGITLPTLSKFATEAGIELQRGRPGNGRHPVVSRSKAA